MTSAKHPSPEQQPAKARGCPVNPFLPENWSPTIAWVDARDAEKVEPPASRKPGGPRP